MKLSEKIIKIRKDNGLSQEEFGEKINVSRQAVSKWESEQSTPDIDKIKDISKEFNLSYDYLLNDDIDEMINSKASEVKEEKKNFKFKLKRILKIVIILLGIYLLVSLYKFIGLTRFYLIANSFSENNQAMFNSFDDGDGNVCNFYTYKVNNIVRVDSFETKFNEETKEYQEKIYNIDYIDLDKKEAYTFWLDEQENKYVCSSMISTYTEEEKESFFERYENPIKDMAVNQISNSLKNRILYSLNPFYQVYIFGKEIRYQSPRTTISTKLTNDYLIENINVKTEFRNPYSFNYSYDYVQDHFTSIKSPFEEYKDRIIMKEDMK